MTNKITKPIYRDIIREILQAKGQLDFAWYIAWSNARAEYRRSFLGPGWLILGTAIGVGGMSVVWSAIFNMKAQEFIPIVTTGIVVWYLLSTSIIGATTLLYRSRDLILNRQISSITVTFTHIFEQLIDFAHNLVVVIFALMLFPKHLSVEIIMVIPGMLLVFVNLIWVVQIIAFVGARYRDLAPLVAAIMQPLFLISPVMYSPEQLGNAKFIAQINPLAYMIELVRGPVIGQPPEAYIWLVSIIMAMIGLAAGCYVTGKFRKQLAYWVN